MFNKHKIEAQNRTEFHSVPHSCNKSHCFLIRVLHNNLHAFVCLVITPS